MNLKWGHVKASEIISEKDQDKNDAMNQHLREEQLDREDYVSLRSPFTLPYA